MEDHPLVGHLVAAVIQWIAALQPAVFFAENVPTYQGTASAAILRAWLLDAGYAVKEVVLDGADFGSLESRQRWFIVAHPPEVALSLDHLQQVAQGAKPTLANVLDPVLRISAIVDARFSLIVDGETASSRMCRGGAQAPRPNVP
jgi:DNA (cytosine-5)-methyltransferase 1